ncbi:ATPase component of general energizing module of ECF transporters [Sporolactobacillus inulinus]|uniref:ATPase component of general energizing module of ECF transporters n=1 Tax=Sporolactobacillus inulinus TaxID=2078 RepID=A0A4Y1ZFH6_9BACL|nr:ATPase component of general energizing module of ECF transporters [Sporolactobacillus inulinus]
MRAAQPADKAAAERSGGKYMEKIIDVHDLSYRYAEEQPDVLKKSISP